MSKILVFTMGKVGSSSVIHALITAGNEVDRAYEENANELFLATDYDAIYTLVRDPIARNISYFFEKYGMQILQENNKMEVVMKSFMDDIDHSYPLTWFDRIFFPSVGLNVYKYKFPPGGPLFLGKVCILRTDQMKDEHRAETETTRPYGSIYHAFKEFARFPESYLQGVYESKFVRHFFTTKEIADLYERWIE